MSDFDIMNEINKVLEMKDMSDYVIVCALLGVIGFILFSMSRKSVPGMGQMLFPALGGAILGAMLYIFNSGTSGGW